MVWYMVRPYGMVWYGMVWYGMVWYGVVWCGMVWCGVVWCGVVGYGRVWYGGYGIVCMVWYTWYMMPSTRYHTTTHLTDHHFTFDDLDLSRQIYS